MSNIFTDSLQSVVEKGLLDSQKVVIFLLIDSLFILDSPKLIVNLSLDPLLSVVGGRLLDSENDITLGLYSFIHFEFFEPDSHFFLATDSLQSVVEGELSDSQKVITLRLYSFILDSPNLMANFSLVYIH